MLTEEAMAVFADHHGMATATMLTIAGMSRRARERAVEAGLLEVIYERVFHIRSSPLTLEARCAGLCMAYPQGYITGPTAGRIARLRRMGNDDLIHFAVPHGSNIGPLDGVRLRQTTRVAPNHISKRADGIRMASPLRLAFDLAADLDAVDLRSVVEQLLSERRFTVSGLAKIGRDLAHPARPGSAKFLAVLASRLPGGPAESHPEVLIADGLQRRGVPVVLQVGHLEVPGVGRVRFDMAVPDARWAVEVDVHPDHLRFSATKDKRRDRGCHRIDWQVDRVTELELSDLEALCDELAEGYRLRCEHLRRRG